MKKKKYITKIRILFKKTNLSIQEDIVMKTIVLKNTDKPTKEQLAQIRAARNRQITIDDDCPAYSYEKLCNMIEKTKRMNTPMQKRREAMFLEQK